MNSLSELNNFGGVALTYTDNRSSLVKFDRVSPLEPINRGYTISSTTQTVTPGIEIVEIVNYALANVRYQVTIYPGDADPLTGSSISFSNVPAHVTSSTAGNVYTLTGLRSVDDWLAVRQFTWNLPANYASKPYWHAEVKIIYYDSALGYDVSKSFVVFDYRFYYFAQLQSTANITQCILSGTQRLTATTISASANLTANGNYATGQLLSGVGSSFSLSATPHLLIENLTTRTYTANNENNIFSTNTPIIGDSNPSTTSTFNVILTSSLGTFSTNSTTTATSPFSITGTLSSVNTALANVNFYPTAGTSSNGTFTFEVKKDAVSQTTATVSLTGSSGTYATTTYSFTSSTLWTPKNADTLYGLADILLVGAGGGAGVQGGGGGGGGVRELLNQTISHQTYTVTVGIGGIGASSAGPIGIPAGNGGWSGYPGGNTTAFGSTAGGGGGGSGYLNLSGGIYTYNKYGGASGSPQSLAGGTYNGTVGYVPSTFNKGGGGGGAGAVGSNGPSGNGGAGVTSTINSLTYGQGGGGYSAGTPSGAPTANSGRGGSDVSLYENGADGFVLIKFHA